MQPRSYNIPNRNYVNYKIQDFRNIYYVEHFSYSNAIMWVNKSTKLIYLNFVHSWWGSKRNGKL